MGAPFEDITGIILCGGKSVRMGRNKALLELGGRRVIDRVTDVMGRLFPSLLLVTNTPDEYAFTGIEAVTDIIPEGGSLVGLCTGLSFMKTDRGFVAACDMPFASEALIRRMVDMHGNEDAIVPRTPDGLQPLFALYKKSALPGLMEVLKSGEKRIHRALDRISVHEIAWEEIRKLDPEGKSFMNVNTPSDWERALAEVGE